jgi:hypothetical protein
MNPFIRHSRATVIVASAENPQIRDPVTMPLVIGAPCYWITVFLSALVSAMTLDNFEARTA